MGRKSFDPAGSCFAAAETVRHIYEGVSEMKCPVCGQVLPEDSQFCQYCGRKLSFREEPPAAAPEEEPAREPGQAGHSQVVLGFLRGSGVSTPPEPEMESAREAASEADPIPEPAAETASAEAPASVNTISAGRGGVKDTTLQEEARSYPYGQQEKARDATVSEKKDTRKSPWLVGAVAALALCLIASLYYAGTLQTQVKELTTSLAGSEASVKELKDQNRTLERQNNTLHRENGELDADLQFLAENIGFVIDGDQETYHRYDCFKVKGSTYEAHNTNYCEWLNYSPCPYCW